MRVALKWFDFAKKFPYIDRAAFTESKPKVSTRFAKYSEDKSINHHRVKR